MDNLEEIIDLFTRTTDKKQMRKQFEELFTPAEIVDFSKRYFIMKEIYKGKPQRAIAKEMEVSPCKITRGSKVLKDFDSEFRKYLSEKYDY